MNDLPTIRNFKDTVKTKLIRRFDVNIPNFDSVLIITALDLRYHGLKFLFTIQRLKVYENVKDMVMNIYDSECAENSLRLVSKTLKKKKKQRYHFYLGNPQLRVVMEYIMK